MTKIDKNTYFIVKDKHGEEHLCPLIKANDKNAESKRVRDDCVKKDVVERYAGNIDYEIG